MNKIKNRRRLVFSAIVVGILIWVGSKVKDHLEFQQEMVRIVHSKEVKELIVHDLKQEDPDAFTETGKIQSYEIDDETIEHNPMGGIMFEVMRLQNYERRCMSNIDLTNDLTYEDKRFMAALLSVKFMGKIALTKATVDQKSIKKRISSSLTELESSLDQVIGTIDSDLAGKFSNSVKEGVERKKLELNALQEFCKTK